MLGKAMWQLTFARTGEASTRVGSGEVVGNGQCWMGKDGWSGKQERNEEDVGCDCMRENI